MDKWRIVKIFLVISCIIVIIYGFIPYLINDYSEDAIVNQTIYTIKSPIEGTVVRLPSEDGYQISPNILLISIVNKRINYGVFFELQTELHSLDQKILQDEEEIKNLNDMLSSLKDRSQKYSADNIAALQIDLHGLEEKLQFDLQLEDQLKKTYKFASTIENEHHDIGRFVYDTKYKELVSVRNEISDLHHQIDRLKIRIQSLGRGVFFGDGHQDVPYSQQREDEIAMKIIDLQAKREEEIERVARIEQQSRAELLRLDESKTYEYKSPYTGVVWKTLVAPESDVVIGAPLLEIIQCDETIVQATFKDKIASKLSYGSRVFVKIDGDSTEYNGMVISVRGGSTIPSDQMAAKLPLSKNPTVLIKVIDYKPKTNNYCDVGQSANVIIKKNVGPIWNTL